MLPLILPIAALILFRNDHAQSIRNIRHQLPYNPSFHGLTVYYNQFGVNRITRLHFSIKDSDHRSSKSSLKIVSDLLSTWKLKNESSDANCDSDEGQLMVSIEPLQEKGFCNALYKVGRPSIGIAKIFSPLAQARMKDSGFEPGQVDTILAERQLGPRIYAASRDGILMEHLPSKALTEEDIHCDHSGNPSALILKAVARGLAKMHSSFDFAACTTEARNTGVKEDDNNNLHRAKPYPNMLWHTVGIMLSMIPDQDKTRIDLEHEVEWQQKTLDALGLPTVLGHGDFKPSNVMVLKDGSARFLDLECAGLNYRAYDLAKFFRAQRNQQMQWTDGNQIEFLSTYLQSIAEESSTKLSNLGGDVQLLQLECSLLLPMTWLEAAIFFECSSYMDAGNQKQWKDMGRKRMIEYNQSKQTFLANVRAYANATSVSPARLKDEDF